MAQANAKGGYRGRIPYELIVSNDNGNWRSSGREAVQMAWKDSVWAILGTVDGANSLSLGKRFTDTGLSNPEVSRLFRGFNGYSPVLKEASDYFEEA